MIKSISSGLIKTVALVSILGALTSCQTKQESGTLIGGLGGALIGSQFGGSGAGRLLGAGIGAVIGSVAGSMIGKNLDEQDQARMKRTAGKSLENSPTGTTSAWKNPDSGNKGTITPTRTYKSPDGEYCREYTSTVTVGGQTEKAYGTACRKPDGSWQIVS